MMTWVSVSLIRELIPLELLSCWEGVFVLVIVIDAFRPPLSLVYIVVIMTPDFTT
jgi:hypothetical protein